MRNEAVGLIKYVNEKMNKLQNVGTRYRQAMCETMMPKKCR